MIMKAYIVNTYPAVYMTRFLLGQMSLRNERSLIINMSSSSGLQPLPFFFLYGASKVFKLHYCFILEISESYGGITLFRIERIEEVEH
jgi:short-subunit dehydrogenase